MDVTAIICLLFAFLLVPASYLGLCVWMSQRQVHRLCYPAYFFLFGIVGGGFLALGLSPSGLAASCIVFLMFAGPFACLGASVALQFSRSRGRFENVARFLGYGYSGFIFTAFLAGQVYRRFH